MPHLMLPFFVLLSVVLMAALAWLIVSRRQLLVDVARYSRFLEYGPFAAYIKNADGQYIYENRELHEQMRTFLSDATTTLGRTDRELFPSHACDSYVAHDRAVIEKGKPQHFDEMSIDHDGTVRHWSSIKFPSLDVHGRPCVAGISIDVTRLRQAESDVQAMRWRFEQFLDAAPFCAYLKDADGRFIFVNRHLRMTYPGVDVGNTVHDLFTAQQADDFTRDDDWIRRTGESVQREEVTQGADGVVRHWSTFKFPVVGESSRRGVGGISIEITDRRQSDELRTRSETLLRRLIEVQEHEKSMLCHEFHDGLTQYAIASRMTLEAWRYANPDVAADAVDQAIRCIDAGVADGRRTMRGIRPEALDDLGLKAAVEEYVDSLICPGLDVLRTVAAEVDGAPEAVQTAAFRIMQEACANARRHSGTDRIHVELRCEADELVMRVEDFGTGFDAASPPRKGFGVMGMAERARLGGGLFNIESVLGRGTVITARLPVALPGG
jgi:signal transduction histidine kinase